MRFHLIIPSSGTGSRFGSRIPKQYLKIGKNEILAHTISKFINIKEIKFIYISALPERFGCIENLIKRNKFSRKKIILAEGGETRQHSVFNALEKIKYAGNEYVIIHDAVRPVIKTSFIKRCMSDAVKFRCVVPCIRASDTIKLSGKNLFVNKTISRESVFLAQTPQIFRLDILKKSYNYAFSTGFSGTDDSSVVEYAGYKVKIIEGDKDNIKVTSKADLKTLKYFYEAPGDINLETRS